MSNPEEAERAIAEADAQTDRVLTANVAYLLEITDLKRERDTARQSFEILYRALCDYGKHRLECMSQSGPPGWAECDCGFGNTLSAAADSIEKWTEGE